MPDIEYIRVEIERTCLFPTRVGRLLQLLLG
jgi:hypothetical protein